ncbi:MAG: prolipoprotein diacylglyceryl transferase [Kofleriaceae bacterium]
MWMSLHAALASLIPYWVPPSIPPRDRGDDGFALQPFGMIVAAGVLIGASIMRRFSERHGVDDDDLRGLTMWIMVTGFIGAHVLDVIMYEPHKLAEDPLVLIKLWDGISSYGGFVGGALGYMFFVWWKRLQWALMADICIVGLLPAFSIGRIGCTIVHDHPGAPTDSIFGFDYPAWFVANLDPNLVGPMRLHNLAMYELAYLIPVNAIILWLAFKKVRRLPAGALAVLTGVLYAPVRFFLDYLRWNKTDPRYLGLTFAQWASIGFFVVAVIVAVRILKHGKVAPLAAELDGKPGGKRVPVAAAAKAKK